MDEHPLPGTRGTMLPIFQSQANTRLLSLEIDAIESTRDQKKRQDLLAQADALCDRVYGKSPDSAPVVGLKGRLELAHNRVVDATQTLKHALALTNPQDPNQQRNRYELMYDLASAASLPSKRARRRSWPLKLSRPIRILFPPE